MTASATDGFAARTVLIPARGVALAGDLTIPPAARGVVVFAHGSGSSRLSPRNRQVAESLHRGALATLLLDLLTSEEGALDAATGQLRFDVNLLALRLADVTGWVASHAATRSLGIGYFGASTGAAAALVAAALRPRLIRAIVSRGGRPDLAGPYLRLVKAPTLLIVGGADTPVIKMNVEASRLLTNTTTQLVIVPRATHLFEERGALEQVATLARDWFQQHLADKAAPDQQAPLQVTSSVD